MRRQGKNNVKTVRRTSIDGLFVLDGPIFSDQRGFFREFVRFSELEKLSGIKFYPVQINHSVSYHRDLHVLHADKWNKIVYPITGRAFSAIADIRKGSNTFAKVKTFFFDEKRRFGLFISKGLVNSICALDQVVHYIYLVDRYYNPKNPGTISVRWDDEDLSIDWPIKDPIMSERDRKNPSLKKRFFLKKNKK